MCGGTCEAAVIAGGGSAKQLGAPLRAQAVVIAVVVFIAGGLPADAATAARAFAQHMCYSVPEERQLSGFAAGAVLIVHGRLSPDVANTAKKAATTAAGLTLETTLIAQDVACRAKHTQHIMYGSRLLHAVLGVASAVFCTRRLKASCRWWWGVSSRACAGVRRYKDRCMD